MLSKPVSFAITKDPEDVSAELDTTVQFTVEATGAVSYQWQYSKNKTSWTNTYLSGAQTATVNVPVTEARYGFYWRCVVKNAGGETLESEGALLSKLITDFTVDNVVYQILDDEQKTVAVKEYLGSAADLVIPGVINGYTVVQIGASAFENNTALESIDLPDSITVIGRRAFAGCSKLSSMK